VSDRYLVRILEAADAGSRFRGSSASKQAPNEGWPSRMEPMNSGDIPSRLLEPKRLYSRSEVLASPSPVPAEPGVYGWYFDAPPGGVPLAGTHGRDGHSLLYIGIAPRKPSAVGKASQRTLRDRLRQHYNLNAYGSTLRLTLGCLLGLELRRIASRKNPGTAKRMTFGPDGEKRLSEWMGQHARVVWCACSEPWLFEATLLNQLVLPLNLDANQRSAFHEALSRVRADARRMARNRPPLS
jgi:hypothetical protein